MRPFSQMEQLEELVELASQPLPRRDDGIVTIAKFTSVTADHCRASETIYDSMARENPATLFLRTFVEYEGATQLFAQAQIIALPTFDVFYKGKRMARIQSMNHNALTDMLRRFQLDNSDLDLFSEDAQRKMDEFVAKERGITDSTLTEIPQATRDVWAEERRKYDPNKTPLTSNRFVPGYDWNRDRGFFDDVGDRMTKQVERAMGIGTDEADDDYDEELQSQFENWIPPNLLDDDKD